MYEMIAISVALPMLMIHDQWPSIRIKLATLLLLFCSKSTGHTLLGALRNLKSVLNVRHTLWDALKTHLKSASNLLDLFAVLTAWLIIPCRIADNDCQWVFAAITYILNALRIFKHTVMFR